MTMRKEEYKAKIGAFVADLTGIERSENTIKKYRLVAERFSESLPEGDITKADVIAFKQALIPKYKPSTIRNYITIANKFIRYCETDDIEDKRSKSKLEVRQIPEQKRASVDNIFNDSEYQRMLKAARNAGMDDMVLMMEIFAHTGIREQELKDFTVEKLKNRTAIVTYSKGKMREIVIPQSLKNRINKYIREKGIESGYLFPSPTDPDRLISRFTVYKRLQKIAGLAKVRLSKSHAHSFRHMFAKKYAEMYPVESLADILGHSSTETTRIYIKTNRDEKREQLSSIKYRK